jgi:hypothetical protein
MRDATRAPIETCGTSGTLIGGIANGGTLDALPIPLGSTLMLLRLPTLAGPGGMPLIKTFPVPAWPAIRANDAAGAAGRRARASFTEVFDTEDSMICQSDRNAARSRRKSPRRARKFVALGSLYVTVPIVAIVEAVSRRVSSKAVHCVLVETQTVVTATDLIPPKPMPPIRAPPPKLAMWPPPSKPPPPPPPRASAAVSRLEASNAVIKVVIIRFIMPLLSVREGPAMNSARQRAASHRAFR